MSQFCVLLLDVYGTLIDWESPIYDALLPSFPNLSRDDILARYAAVEADLQAQFPTTPYTRILQLAYRQLTDGVTTADRFATSIPHWKPFPDTLPALHALKKHFALVVLSNVDDASFAATHAALCSLDYPGSAYPTLTPTSPFSLVLTAHQVGAYKPDPMMLESALRQLSACPDPSLPSNAFVRANPSEVLVVANSIRHDILPAKQHALRSVWISRRGVIGNEILAARSSEEGGAKGKNCPYTWRYETLGQMADAMQGQEPIFDTTMP